MSDKSASEASAEMPSVESTFQESLSRTFGAGVDPTVHLRDDDASAFPSAARLDGLATKTHTRYVLEGELGRGGMGAVLKVFDTDLRRNLAMKVILGTGSGTDAATDQVSLARFLEEAQVSGQLEHPGVVPVHELGLDSEGNVYFTMRLVRGRELKDVFELVHADDEKWSVTRALGVLLKVCEAMAYAHDKGVVHRDLKPANIMVGKYGEVYVMDWGLARVEGRADTRDLRLEPSIASLSKVRTDRKESRQEQVDSPIVTMDGTVVGTPAYMPPEQARGQIERVDQRSDVYSVGAMLYQLLTGCVPFVPADARVSARTILMRVLEGPPKPLREVATENVPAELEAICEKAMAREAADRYADMGELAEDLRAFLENRVVQAHRTGALVELKKWVQRNRGLAAALAALVVLTVGGSTSAAVVFAGKNNEIRVARDDALEATDLADTARAASESVTDFLVSQFQGLEPEATRGKPVQVSELLDRAVESLEAMDASPNEAARVRRVLGDAYYSLGLYERAEPLLERVWRDQESLLGEDHPETLGLLHNLATLYKSQGRYAEAEPLYTQALERMRDVLGEDHPGTLIALGNLAMLYYFQGRYAEAEPLLIQALKKCREVLGGDHPDTLTSLSNLAGLYQDQGRYAEAEPLYTQALEKSGKVRGEDHPHTLTSLNNMARLYQSQGRYAEAEPLYTQALEKSRKVLGEDHPETLLVLGDLAHLYESQGRYAEAEPLCIQVLEKRRKVLGEDHSFTLISLYNLAAVYQSQGRYAEAEPLCIQVLERMRAVLGEDHLDTLTSLSSLASVYQSQGRYEEAEPLCIQVLETHRKVLGEDHPGTLRALSNLASLYGDQGRYAEAEPLCIQVLEKRREMLGEDHPDTLKSLGNLVGLYSQWLHVLRDTHGPEHPTTLTALRNLGAYWMSSGRYDDAEAAFLECLEKRIEVLDVDHPDALVSFQDLAELYARQERWEDAEALAGELLERTPEDADEYAARKELLERIVEERP